MLSYRQRRQATRIIFWVGLAALVLFYAPHYEQGLTTPNFLPTPFRAVTKTVTRFVSVTQILTSAPAPPPRLKLEKHIYRPDGLLEVNHNGPHPIFGLIRQAEKDWEEKLNKASKTLADAVKEYQRRYKRDPPKGFDVW